MLNGYEKMIKFDIFQDNGMLTVLNKNNKIRKLLKVINFRYILAVILAFLMSFSYVDAQQASPVNWLYPKGNAQATRHIDSRSAAQNIDSIKVKWSTGQISGDVQPLIGNIIDNPKIFEEFNYAPNEIAAIVADKVVIVGGTGRVFTETSLPAASITGAKDISCLIDTTAGEFGRDVTWPVVMGIETFEVQRPDSMAVAYIAGFNRAYDTVNILARLAIDLRHPYGSYGNASGSLRPVFGKKENGNLLVYATANMSTPTMENYDYVFPPFLRGLTVFNVGDALSMYPLPDIGDDVNSRLTLGPEVSFSQPSVSLYGDDYTGILLPSFPTDSLIDFVENPVTFETYPNIPYLVGLDITGEQITQNIAPLDLYSQLNIDEVTNKRPVIRTYYVDIHDNNPSASDSLFILVTEEYKGIDGSNGTSKLHLFDQYGSDVTFAGSSAEPPFNGDKNHMWSVAIGDIDGRSDNHWPPYFPNNYGNEIIVTQTTPEFAVAASKLYVLRYNSNLDLQKKPSPPGAELFPFDTICTSRVNGWVAAVNDIDGNSDEKEEILLVDGSRLLILRMKNYSDELFRLGRPFDTVYTQTFNKQTISAVSVADLEGDGKNDIIVTTHDSTYVIGSVLEHLLDMVSHTDSTEYPTDFCPDEVITLEWRNIVPGQNMVNIQFLPYDDSDNPLHDELTLIESNFENLLDTVTYEYTIDNRVLGKRGKFIVESIYNSWKIFDTTMVLSFHNPEIELNDPEYYEYKCGEFIDMEGSIICVDTILIQYSTDSLKTWQDFAKDSLKIDDFLINEKLPCVEEFFYCSPPDSSNRLFLRAIGQKGVYVDTSNVVWLDLLPAEFPVQWDSCETACPSIEFYWDMLEIDEDFPCDTMSMYISVDEGETFNYLLSLPTAETESYLWQIPTNIPDSVIMRFCCDNSCVRSDKELKDFKPKYIQIIAPNPFSPLRETVEFTYTVPEDLLVTIRIFDQNNRLVAQPVTDAPRSMNVVYCDRWDGTVRDGSPAANGMYYLSLEFSNGAKEIHHVFVRK